MCTVVHARIVVLCKIEIFLRAEVFVSSGTRQHHPGDIVVEFVVGPVATVAAAEVYDKFVENLFIFKITCSGESIKDDFEHLCVAPPAATAEHMTRRCLMVVLTEES